MSSSVYLAVPVMVVLSILQSAFLSRFPLLGMVPQLPLLIALAWGFLHGINEGVVWAFWAGIALDLFTTGPMGASAIAFVGGVVLATWVEQALPPNRIFLPPLLAALATLISLFLYLLLLSLFGRAVSAQSFLDSLPLLLLHGGLILPIYWLTGGIERLVTVRGSRVR